MARKMMLKEIEFDVSGDEWVATYRVNKMVAENLQALLDANENGESYNGETPYAIYQVRKENGKFYADFAHTAFETCDAGEQFHWGPIECDLKTAGFQRYKE